MAIERQIRTRAVQAVIAFIRADADFAEKTDSGRLIYAAPFTGQVAMTPSPRQMHVYAGASTKNPGTGAAWDRVFEVIIEFYSPRDERPPADDAVTIDDEIDTLANRLYTGQVARSPGRFEDPDNAGSYITTSIEAIRVTGPAESDANAAIRRELSILFRTREDAGGTRV